MLAEVIGITYGILHDKILNRRDFKSQEVYKIANTLKLSKKEIIDIFYSCYGGEE